MTASTELPAYGDRWQETLNWQPAPSQQAVFQQLYAEVLAANQQFNLTRITEPSDFWEKHLWDSLSGLAPWLTPDFSWPLPELLRSPQLRVIDIGTGAGFPGLPAAIARPDWQVTLLDSTQKKIRFLKTLAESLQLNNVKGLASRAETVGHQRHQRQKFHVALVRAVGSASTCAEYALPLLQVGGVAVLYRGQWSAADTEALAPALELMGGAIAHIQPGTTPLTQGQRHCLYLQKTEPTPLDLPRPVGIPAKLPL
ncbi:16S rRNA (guanine(527)-N(7))-methyltransferase RsmG [Sphaerothrix gracilis]|uniref:16S rRNA (guanine(527)-N(7))-methyltransferase RsmG n=1 Tax=Sphaerothrix gracilis TaxID=3151835 RepID=UPI0031FC1CD7